MQMKKSAFLSGAALLGGAATVAFQYRRWQQASAIDLIAGSRIAATAAGPVEYLRQGRGPTVLVSHGAPGGYDEGFLLADLTLSGFTLLSPSRPGYLRTPLTVGQTPEQQADALALTLDALGIARAAMVGISAGGPAALQFALRHPDRIWGLVLESAVTQTYQPLQDAGDSLLGRLFLGEDGADFFLWTLSGLARLLPRQVLSAFLKQVSTLDADGIARAVDVVMNSPQQLAFFRKLLQTTMPLALRQAGLDNDLAQFAALPRYPLGALTVPTLVMHSPCDNDVPLSHAQFAAQTIPGAELALYEAAGHFLWLGADADQVAARRLAFLRRHAPAE